MRPTVFIALLGVGAPAYALDITVNPGDDVAAATASLSAGSVITFADGVHELTDTLYWVGYGTETQPVTLQAEAGASPVLRQTAGWWVADVTETTYLTIRGLTFEGDELWEEGDYGGVRIADSSFVTLEDCIVRQVPGTGIRVDGSTSDILIQRNEVSNTFNASGIYVGCYDASCWMQSSVIASNLVHTIGGEGSYGLHLSHGSQGIEVRDNIFYEMEYRGIYVGSAEFGEPNRIVGNAVWIVGDDAIHLEGSAIVQNNLIFDALGNGIEADDSDRNGLLDLAISFNTIVNTLDYGVYLEEWYDKPGMVLANNVIANPTGLGLYYDWDDLEVEAQLTDNYISTNVVTGFVGGVDQELRPDWIVAGGGYGDFLSVEDWDFYPDARGMLVDVGDPAGSAYVPELDFNGVPRDGDTPDVGAYEWTSDTNPGWVVQQGFKELGYVEDNRVFDVSGDGCCSGKSDDGGKEALVFLPLLGFGVLGRRRRRS